MSAEIIRFIPRPKHDREQTDFPTIVFCSAVPDDLPWVMPTIRRL